MNTATVTELFEDTRNLRRLARALVADVAADDLVQDAMIVAAPTACFAVSSALRFSSCSRTSAVSSA